MRTIFLFILISFVATNSYAQKMNGFGGELSMLGLKTNVRMWVSKTTGFEVFTGMDSELESFKPNDLVAGFKYLYAFTYSRTERTYFGLQGKWKWLNIYGSTKQTNLPIPGLLIGKEWYSKRAQMKGLAIELGYQFGSKKYKIYSPVNHILLGEESFAEFPMILNLRYSFYKKK